MTDDRTILFYDGECGLCDRSVRWAMDRDRRVGLRYAPLQGQTYGELDIDDKPTDVSTVVLLDGGRLFVGSDAVLRLLRRIGGVWGFLGGIGGMVPRRLRDALYRFVARRRLKWFGGREACRLPTSRERERLLP